jgi:hypothetical protein
MGMIMFRTFFKTLTFILVFFVIHLPNVSFGLDSGDALNSIDKRMQDVMKELDQTINDLDQEQIKKDKQLASEKAEQERLAAEKAEKVEQERLAAEQAEQERLAAEKVEQERLTAEKAEQERLAAEKVEQERLAAEQAEQERLAAEKVEQERLAAEKAEQERLAAEKVEQERLAAEKAEQERLTAEKVEQERLAAEKAEQERLAAEKVEQERLAAEKAEQERLAAEKVEQERLAKEKAEQERLAAETKDVNVVKEFSGSGGKNTRPFTVNNEWEIQWDAKGDIFQLFLYTANGEMTDLPANQQGSGKGSSYQAKGGQYYLQVNAIDNWAIKVVQTGGQSSNVEENKSNITSSEIATFSGSGGKNTRPFTSIGPWEIQWDAKGDLFQLMLYTASGEMTGIPANQQGSGKGTSFQPKAGKYYLKVNAIGTWSIKIVPVR